MDSVAVARMRVVAVGSIAALSAVLSALVVPTARATPPGWGPDAIPYRAGLVCTDTAGSSALVSWPSAATTAPAFALTPITADPTGTTVARPAVDTTSATPLADPGATALAALLARQGDTRNAATAAEVAAAVLDRGTTDPRTAQCLSHGASAPAATALWAEAARLAGPYTVHADVAAAKLTLGRPAAVSAVVTSASGVPVPGVAVTFDSDAHVSRASAVTDAAGRATTSLLVPAGSTARAARLVVHARVPGTPVVMTEPGAVSLVAAGADVAVTDTAVVPVDTTADPHMTISLDRTLVLPGTVVRPTVSVTGLRGHSGTTRLIVRGPLPLRDRHCAAATRRQSHSATVVNTPPVAVARDGSYPTGQMRMARPGCYRLTSRVATRDAIPNVRRTSGSQVITVAPVRVSVDPAGQGVSGTGRLSARVRVTGLHARLTDVNATVVGPSPSNDGTCTGVTPHGAVTEMHATGSNDAPTVTSAPLTMIGCYAVQVLGTVSIPGLGSTPLAWSPPVSATTFVVDPAATLAGISTSAVTAGEQLHASVTVSGSWTQPGRLSLRLRYLPYDWRGCIGRDWSRARTVGPAGPDVVTTGDGTYSVTSPAVPSVGCWTVVPTLTLNRNRAISVGDAGDDRTTAFTGLPAQAAPTAQHSELHVDSGYARVVGAGIAMVLLLIIAFARTVSLARED
ncbi:MAG TPA: Ig-like domain-containing protein [Jatrophihabitans sp.]